MIRRRFTGIIGFLACMLMVLTGVMGVAHSDSAQPLQEVWDQPIGDNPGPKEPRGATRTPKNEYPTDPNSPRVPDGPTNNGDINDPFLSAGPAPDFQFRGGYAATVDDRAYNNGAGLGVVVMLIEGTRTALVAGAQLAGTQGGVFAYAQGDIKIRYRWAIDPNHVVWGGIGADIAGRGSLDPQVDSFFRAQLPMAFIGAMVHVGSDCVIRLFAKAAFGIWDNQNQSSKSSWAPNMDHFVRPAVGVEAFANCGTVRVTADYQHIFTFGSTGGSTDRAVVDFSQAFPVTSDGAVRVGYFLKGEYVYEKSPSVDSGLNDRNIGSLFGGLEVRWGASAKWKPKPR